MVYAVSIVRVVVIAGLLYLEAVNVGHHHRGVHLHFAGGESLVSVNLRVVVIADPFQKLRKAHIFCSVWRNAAVI